MGVDCRIVLPGNVRLQTVAEVIGIAAGLKYGWQKIRNGSRGSFKVVNVPGVICSPYNNTYLASAKITLNGLMVDGELKRDIMYHFEADHPHCGCRIMLPRSTAFWIGIGRRLVDFFGGILDQLDCDDIDVDYSVPFKSDQENMPDDGEPFFDGERRLSEVQPLTQDELRLFDSLAAYKSADAI